jgi:hypothetical protein
MPSPEVEVNAADVADYFRQIAFGSEYGDAGACIRKWSVPLQLTVSGEPTAEDRATLERAMAGLNAIHGFPGARIVPSGGNVSIHFVSLKQMPQVIPSYIAGNWGFFSTFLEGGSIHRAQIAIATDVTTQQARNHLIYEELLQSTGLMLDADDYPKSIYYGQWTTVQQPMSLDWELLRLLYLPGVKSGMAPDEAMVIARRELGLEK